MKPVLDWLLEGDPWVEYATRLHLLHQSREDERVASSRSAMLAHPLVKGLINELQDWPGVMVNSHKSAGTLLHKIAFAADIGLRADDPGMPLVVERVLQHLDPLGPVQMRTNVSPKYGGSGQDTWGWALCDSPTILYALARMGLGDDPRIRAGVEHLVTLARTNGWPCAVSAELGSWRGPGRKDDPCPYATLIMLKLLAEFPDLCDSPAARYGTEALLNAWQRRRDFHPYIFHMGTDFSRLKAPLVWYDLLHVTHVLTRFPWLQGDSRLREMLTLLREQADAQGRYTPGSVWMAWKEWEFGQKKVPSRWLTCLVLMTLQNG